MSKGISWATKLADGRTIRTSVLYGARGESVEARVIDPAAGRVLGTATGRLIEYRETVASPIRFAVSSADVIVKGERSMKRAVEAFGSAVAMKAVGR